jgi:uncharacterized protein YxjI
MSSDRADTRQLLDLSRYSSVRISERAKTIELPACSERKNRWDVLVPDGQVIAHLTNSTAQTRKVSPGFGHRDQVDLFNTTGDHILSIKDRWTFSTAKYLVDSPDGQSMFKVQQRFAIFRRKFGISGDGGTELRIEGSRIHRRTFKVYEGERLIGKITKRFRCIRKSFRSNTGMFDVEILDPEADQQRRLKMLVTSFVVDHVSHKYCSIVWDAAFGGINNPGV